MTKGKGNIKVWLHCSIKEGIGLEASSASAGHSPNLNASYSFGLDETLDSLG